MGGAKRALSEKAAAFPIVFIRFLFSFLVALNSADYIFAQPSCIFPFCLDLGAMLRKVSFKFSPNKQIWFAFNLGALLRFFHEIKEFSYILSLPLFKAVAKEVIFNPHYCPPRGALAFLRKMASNEN